MTVRAATSALFCVLALDACAAAPPAGPPSTTAPAIRCRTVLDVRPGPLGTASSATPVQQCEPEVPTPPPE